MPPKKEYKSAGTLLKDMAVDSQLRTTERSKMLMDEYEANLGDLEDKIEEKTAENKDVLSAIRKDQLTRLTALIRKRTEIEMAITEKTARLNRAYEKASADLRRSTKQRAGRIEEAVAAAGADSGDQEEEEQSREDKENEAPPVPVVKLAVAPTRTRGAARVWGSRRFVDGTR